MTAPWQRAPVTHRRFIRPRLSLQARAVQVGALAVLLGIAGGSLSGCSAEDSVEVLREAPYSALVHDDAVRTADQSVYGKVGHNAAGCVTVGRAVVVLPARSYLHFDGSVTIEGHEYFQGASLFGTGASRHVTDSTCGDDANYVWIQHVALTPN